MSTMNLSSKEPDLDAESRHVRWACYHYWQSESLHLPPDQRSICYTWVRRQYEGRFVMSFHQSRLTLLAKLGFLAKDDTARGGSRRYYKLVNPERTQELLTEWGLQ